MVHIDHITKLDSYLMTYIMYFLLNEDIFNMEKTTLYWKQMLQDQILRQNIIYRPHPIVFNTLSNYCFTCNLRMTIIIEKDSPLDIANCNHLPYNLHANTTNPSTPPPPTPPTPPPKPPTKPPTNNPQINNKIQ